MDPSLPKLQNFGTTFSMSPTPCHSNSEIKIKTEPEENDIEFNLEELHHSFDIKDEDYEEAAMHEDEVERAHEDQLGQQFACEICYIEFTNELQLTQHTKIHQKPLKQFKCQVCNYVCSRNYNFKFHLMGHAGEKPLGCQICDYRCIRNHHLKQHMATHKRETPYVCEICKFKCSTETGLEAHKNKHFRQRHYFCDICSKTYVTKQNLKNHTIIHTGEKPFSCEFCDFASPTNARLKIHIMTHTGEKPFTCEACGYRTTTKYKLKNHAIRCTKKTS